MEGVPKLLLLCRVRTCRETRKTESRRAAHTGREGRWTALREDKASRSAARVELTVIEKGEHTLARWPLVPSQHYQPQEYECKRSKQTAMLLSQYTEDPDVQSIGLLPKLEGQSGIRRTLQIGRSNDSDIVLDSRRVPLLISRRHAQLSRRGSHLVLRDLSSVNGTFVNEIRLNQHEERVLKEGDLLSFGGARMLRQANKIEDEPNPFLFKLMDPGRIFVGISTPSAIARIQQPNGAAEEVVDLTSDTSPEIMGGTSGSRALTPDRKRARINNQTPILIEDGSDDEPQLVPFQRGRPAAAAPGLDGGAGPSTGAAAAGPAGSNSAMLKALESELECQICRDFMVAAHSLVPCGHMFCGECVAEWLQKKCSCPSCRTVTTAAPVPSLKIDNLLEEAVVPEMDQASRNERQRRRGSWAANGKRLTARLQQQFSRSQAAQQYSRMHGGVASPEQFQYIQGLMEAALGSLGTPPAPRSSRRYRAARTRSGGAASSSISNHMPPPYLLPTAVGPLSFSMLAGSNTVRRVCAVCDSLLHANQAYLVDGDCGRCYHLVCARRVPGFQEQWRQANGNLPGHHLVPTAAMARLRRMVEPQEWQRRR